jgi:hypothetical protein
MIILVAGGDSHVWGSELKDSPHGGINGYSRNTFPALLYDNYSCVAYPGIGNKEIAQRVINACDHNIHCNSHNIVIVCWSWPGRDNQVDSDNHILKLQDYLIANQIPYMFTCVDNCIITENDQIDYSKWFMFPPGKTDRFGNEVDETITSRGFYQWAIENKYSIGADGHPLEDAHKDAAELIKEKFNELVKKSI